MLLVVALLMNRPCFVLWMVASVGGGAGHLHTRTTAKQERLVGMVSDVQLRGEAGGRGE